jgi:hypothetical protein
MPAIPRAIPSAVEPVSAGLNQQIGTESGTDASYGFAETTGSPANIPGGQVSPTLPGNPFAEYLDFIGEAASEYHSEPMRTGIGPTIPYEASVPQAQVAHGEDDGSSARNLHFPKPPKNQYFTDVVKTPVYENSTTYNPDGSLAYRPMGNSQVGTNILTGDHTNLNVGLGYYIQESDRPFYNTLAAVAPVLGPAINPFTPGGQEVQGWNDGGIPSQYAGTPDPYVAPSASGTEAPALGIGF